MNRNLNPEMLILARELRGLTQSQLAEQASIDQGLISRYESGLRDVNSKDLTDIARVLDYPTSFFFRTGQRYGLGSSNLYHRKRQSLGVGHLKKIYAKMNLLRMDLELLLDGVELETPYTFPQYEVQEIGNIDKIADLVRATWKLPMGPISNLVSAIEDAGGIVYVYDFGTRKIDAIAQCIPPLPPIFLVNSAIPGDRLRHTLAHEIGHLVMHAVPSETMEEEADKFAAAFLMPEKEISTDLDPVTLPHLAQLKLYWKVSIQALIRRSRDLGKISERQYRSLFTKLTKLGYRLSEPNPLPLERPTLINDIINVYLSEHKYDIGELARKLSKFEDEFRKDYLESIDHLRIIDGKQKQKRIDL